MTAPRLAQVVRADLNPEWAEAVFALECAADGSSRLKVVVWDHDKGMRADHLGELEMALEPRGFQVRSQSAAPSPSATQPPPRCI